MITELFVCSLLVVLGRLEGASSSCCDQVSSYESCETVCDQLHTETELTKQLPLLSEVAHTCPRHLVEFWQCINNTYAVVSLADQWSGRTCCDLPLSSQCRNSCQRAKSRSDLSPSCRPNDELAFFSCLERKERSDECCAHAISSQCLGLCKALFVMESPPSRNQVQKLNRECQNQPLVVNCVHNFTKSAPEFNTMQSLDCCKHGSQKCKEDCQKAIQNLTAEEEIITQLTGSCGVPNPADPVWQCFLMGSSNNIRHHYHHGGSIEMTGIDGAKLHCCAKAVTNKCRNLCVKTYSRSFTDSWNQFHHDCGYNPREEELHNCLEEVEHPCLLGCSGLDYCTNFNNRPTELFRSCTTEADNGARQDTTRWQESKKIYLPMMTDIPLKDIRTCRPETWKAIACALQVKPCHGEAQSTSICKSDCVRILTECVDHTRLPQEMTVDFICDSLSPSDVTEPCLSLSNYLDESDYANIYKQVTNPCKPNPCVDGHICMINRRKCKHRTDCKPYICRPGCPLGEVSTYLVPHHSYVVFPVPESNRLKCHRVCKCGHNNLLHKCQQLSCVETRQCLLGLGRIHDHKSVFNLGCKVCVCFNGEVVCTQKECLNTNAPEAERLKYTGLPCNCRSEYSPVCGHNGKTYPSACIARCLRIPNNQLTHGGSCDVRDPCADAPCSIDDVCVKRRQVCLSTHKTACKQYVCIKSESECNHHHHDPVCDTTGEEFTNPCLLLQRGRTIAYWGHCLSGCKSSGIVCGLDGQKYESECSAWSNKVVVDYYGPCRAIGKIQLKQVSSCTDIECPSIASSANCSPIIPPAACCPVCVGEIRVLFSQKKMDRVAEVAVSPPITIHNVTDVFGQLMTVRECDVFGYLSVEGDLVLLVKPVFPEPTPLQVEACMKETSRFSHYIKSDSPILMSHLVVSPFLTATTRLSHTVIINSASTLSSLNYIIWSIVNILCLQLICR